MQFGAFDQRALLVRRRDHFPPATVGQHRPAGGGLRRERPFRAGGGFRFTFDFVASEHAKAVDGGGQEGLGVLRDRDSFLAGADRRFGHRQRDRLVRTGEAVAVL